MRKFMFFAFFAICAVGGGYAQEISNEEVRKALENYILDPTSKSGALYAQRSRFLSDTVQLKNVGVGRVLQGYRFKHVFLNDYPDTVPFIELIEPSSRWRASITAHGKPAYEMWFSITYHDIPGAELMFELDNSKEKVFLVGMSELSSNGELWGTLSKTYPEAAGINPVFISMWPNVVLYFKESGKLYYDDNGSVTTNEMLVKLLPKLTDNTTLSNRKGDSQSFIGGLKKGGINEVGISIEETRRRRQGVRVRERGGK